MVNNILTLWQKNKQNNKNRETQEQKAMKTNECLKKICPIA